MKPFHVLALAATGALLAAAVRPAPAAQTARFLGRDDVSVRVVLSGPGSFELVRHPTQADVVSSLVLTGTTPASRLRIDVGRTAEGPGWLDFESVRCDGPLGEIRAPRCSFSGEGMQLPGGVRRIVIGDLHAELRVGAQSGHVGAPLRIRAGWINSGSSIVAPERSLDVTAEGVNGSFVNVADVRRLVASQVTATIRATGRIGLVRCREAGGVLSADEILSIRVERRRGEGGSMGRCIVAARRIGVVRVDTTLSNSMILAGTDLGADAALGGEGVSADVSGPGVLGSVVVRGDVTGSILGAGYVPVNGVYGDEDDTIVGGTASRIGSVSVGESFGGGSLIGAGRFGPIRIAGSLVQPEDASPFVTQSLP